METDEAERAKTRLIRSRWRAPSRIQMADADVDAAAHVSGSLSCGFAPLLLAYLTWIDGADEGDRPEVLPRGG